jgi:biopolymer transport protein ExbD
MGHDPVRKDVLQERVRQKMQTLADKQVYLSGDRRLFYGDLMDVFERLKGAGVEKVGLETEMPDSR